MSSIQINNYNQILYSDFGDIPIDNFLFVLKKKTGIFGQLTSKERLKIVDHVKKYLISNTDHLQQADQNKRLLFLKKFSRRMSSLFTKLHDNDEIEARDLAKTANFIQKILNEKLDLPLNFTPVTLIGPFKKEEVLSYQDIASHNSESLLKCIASDIGEKGTTNFNKVITSSQTFRIVSLYLQQSPKYQSLVNIENVSEILELALLHNLTPLIQKCSFIVLFEMQKAIKSNDFDLAEQIYVNIIKPITELLPIHDIKFQILFDLDNLMNMPEYQLFFAKSEYEMKFTNAHLPQAITKDNLLKETESLQNKDGFEFLASYFSCENFILSHLKGFQDQNDPLYNNADMLNIVWEAMNKLPYVTKKIVDEVFEISAAEATWLEKYCCHRVSLTPLPHLPFRFQNLPLIKATPSQEFSKRIAKKSKLEHMQYFIDEAKDLNALFLLRFIVQSFKEDLNHFEEICKLLNENLTKEQIQKVNLVFIDSEISGSETEKQLREMVQKTQEAFPDMEIPIIRFKSEDNQILCITQGKVCEENNALEISCDQKNDKGEEKE